MTELNQSDAGHHEPQDQRSLNTIAEKTTLIIASAILAVVVALVGYLGLDAKNKTPPDLSLSRSGAIWEASGQFYVPFEVQNQGGKTAEAVQVIAELKVNGEVIEFGEQQIDFLSSGELEEGAFIFTQDPRQGVLSLRVSSYKLP
jgi:uncharacterized protein (TIGR02588 family)